MIHEHGSFLASFLFFLLLSLRQQILPLVSARILERQSNEQ